MGEIVPFFGVIVNGHVIYGPVVDEDGYAIDPSHWEDPSVRRFLMEDSGFSPDNEVHLALMEYLRNEPCKKGEQLINILLSQGREEEYPKTVICDKSCFYKAAGMGNPYKSIAAFDAAMP